MKKYNIAFTGVFDIENYGDHLFPLIFKEKMKENKIDCNLFLFSPIGNMEQGYGQNNTVYPLCELQQLHDKYHFDAIVVGGGGILHYASGKQLLNKQSQDYVDYRVFETWVIPSVFALKNKIKIIWNLLGGFHEFNSFFQPLTRALCQNVDYISVRDNYTKDILLSCNIPEEKIYTCLDSAFVMKNLYSKNDMEIIKNEVLDSHNYVIYHANIHLPDNEIPNLVSNLYSLKKQGYDIVLLPIAYTHNDQKVLNKINDFSIKTYGEEGQFILLGDELNIMSIMALLACCKMYIGVSFHGAVTALSFSNIAIGYDYMNNGKTKNLFSTLNLKDYYVTNSNQLESTINLALNNDYNIHLDEEIIKINNHFDKVNQILQSPFLEKNEDNFFREFSQTIFELYNFYEDYYLKETQLKQLDQLARATHIHLETLKSQYQNLNIEYQNIASELSRIKNKKIYKICHKIKKIFKK